MDAFNQIDLNTICKHCQHFVDDIRQHNQNNSHHTI